MDQIGKYEILDKIGSGGFAVVYKGYDPYIKRSVAIKVCYSRDPETRERFQREAEIAGLLEHRNITAVFDAGVHEQTPYLVEEYLSGEDLAHMIRRREPEPLEEKLDFLLQIASGLGYAHTKGVIHRDIKPGNIRVLDNGRVKIMDFGTAKLANVESNLTQTGMTLGTVAYLSPERLLGQASGTNSDIFSYGVLAYELLSFRRPFSGRNIPNLIDQVLNASPILLQEVWADCPTMLAEVVHRCLRKDPGERYSSCEQVQTDLETIRQDLFPRTQTVTTEPPISGTVISVQLSGLLERARELFDRGKYERAAVLLDEVLEIAPENRDAKQLLASCQAAIDRARGETTPIPTTSETQPLGGAFEAPDARRRRKVQEAVTSIRSFTATGELVQAAEALRFAARFLGNFEENGDLRKGIVDRLRQGILELKSSAMHRARDLVTQMEALHTKDQLPLELAETFTEWVDDLDPENLSARGLLEQVRQSRHRSQPPAESDRKRQEAVSSIEKLLDEGNPELAAQALDFAVRLFGEFDQVPRLRQRIEQARRPRG